MFEIVICERMDERMLWNLSNKYNHNFTKYIEYDF